MLGTIIKIKNKTAKSGSDYNLISVFLPEIKEHVSVCVFDSEVHFDCFKPGDVVDVYNHRDGVTYAHHRMVIPNWVVENREAATVKDDNMRDLDDWYDQGEGNNDE